jgi:hypothetical protein
MCNSPYVFEKPIENIKYKIQWQFLRKYDEE